MTTRKLAVYLVVAFALAWVLQALAILSATLLPSTLDATAAALVPPLIFQVLAAVSMFAPLLAVLVACRGLGVARSGIHWRLLLKGRLRWIAAAWLGPIVFVLLGATLYFVCFPGDFTPSGGMLASMLPADTEMPFSPEVLTLIQLGSALTYGPLINVFFAVGEEAGWRGFMVPILMEKLGRVAGQIIGGIIWGVWHWPLIIFVGYEYGTGYPGAPFLGMACMCLFATVLGILLQFLYERSRSIWIPSLAHGAVNAGAGLPFLFMPAETTHYLLGPTLAGPLALLPALLVAVMVLVRGGRARKAQEEQAPASVPL
jgi:membrane protease YdiL (CAAX protease family)